MQMDNPENPKIMEDFIRAVRTRQPFEVLTGEKEAFPH